MLKNNRGISLIELLAALTLLSLIFLLVSSFTIFGQKQMNSQSSQIDNQANVRLAINIISKEIRCADRLVISNDNVLTINNTEKYQLTDTTITKNDTALIKGIEEFIINKEGSKINITITSLPDKNINSVTLSTVIYMRE